MSNITQNMEDTYIGVAKRKIATLMNQRDFLKITEIEDSFILMEFDTGYIAKVSNFGRVDWVEA